MASTSRIVIPLLALAAIGCKMSDDDTARTPGFIFQCVDAKGCGRANEYNIHGRGDVFGPVATNREFQIYYGTVDKPGRDEDFHEENIYPTEGVEIVSAVRAGYPFVLTESGRFAFIAMKNGEVVDYLHVAAQQMYLDDSDIDDAGVDSEDTAPDAGDDTESMDTDTNDTGSDTEAPDAGDAIVHDKVDVRQVTQVRDSESEPVLVVDSDEPDAGMDAGVDTEEPMDAGIDGGADGDSSQADGQTPAPGARR